MSRIIYDREALSEDRKADTRREEKPVLSSKTKDILKKTCSLDESEREIPEAVLPKDFFAHYSNV